MFSKPPTGWALADLLSIVGLRQQSSSVLMQWNLLDDREALSALVDRSAPVSKLHIRRPVDGAFLSLTAPGRGSPPIVMPMQPVSLHDRTKLEKWAESAAEKSCAL